MTHVVPAQNESWAAALAVPPAAQDADVTGRVVRRAPDLVEVAAVRVRERAGGAVRGHAGRAAGGVDVARARAGRRAGGWRRRLAPLLVGLAVAGPQDDLRAVGGGGAGGVQAQPGLHTGDRAVGVDVPLLVGLTVAVPDDHLGAVGTTLAVRVQTLTAEHLQLAARRVGPGLVRLTTAVPQLHLRAVRGGGVGHIQAATRLSRPQSVWAYRLSRPTQRCRRSPASGRRR